MPRAPGQVRAVTPTATVSPTQSADFACAYAVEIRPGDGRSSEQWARVAWEGASAPMRWFIVAGWRFVLGLRLGPRNSPDYILGWQIVERRPDETVCRLQSWFLHAYNTFRLDGGRLVWSTLVVYERPIARLVWPPVSLLHRPMVRIALRRASMRA